MHWAKQGVLLLNACLTVRAHKANSHKKKGWETFTDNVIKEVSDKKKNVVFLLWGKPAQEKGAVVDTSRHFVLKSAHVGNKKRNECVAFASICIEGREVF